MILELATVGLYSHLAAEERTDNIACGLCPLNIGTCYLQTIILQFSQVHEKQNCKVFINSESEAKILILLCYVYLG